MVYVSIPLTDVDAGSPVDELLTVTIKEDLDDLDARTTDNTDAIALIGGGGGGGGYNNMLYFDAPGSWTSPVTTSVTATMISSSGVGGGGGGSGASYQPTGFAAGAGGNGGNGSNTVLSNVTLTASSGGAGGAQTTDPNNTIVNPGTVAPNNSSINNLKFDNDLLGIISITTGGTGGIGSTSTAPGTTKGGDGASGGNAFSGQYELSLNQNTVYPITIGQAGAGGGGGSGSNPGGISAAGGVGGLVPHSFLTTVGNNASNAIAPSAGANYGGGVGAGPNGGTGGVAIPGSPFGGSGAGGGTGVHGYAILYFNG